MGDVVSRVALVVPSNRDRELIRKMVLGMDWVLLDTECTHYDSAAGIIAESKPDGVLIALDDEPAAAMQLVAKLTQMYSRLPLIVLSSRPDRLVQAHRRGARSLLDYPVQLEDLSVALRNLSQGNSLHRPPKGLVVAFLSSRGGVGTTSLAVNLSCTLALEPSNRVVLIDLDLVTGAADVALDLVPEYRMPDITQTLERLDLHLLSQSLTKDDTGLLVLPRPLYFKEIGLINPEHVQRFITLLRITSTHVFLDLSKGWLATDLKALQLADIIFFVAQTELASIRNAALMLRSLADEGLADKVWLVMNRVGADFGEDGITVKKAEEVLGRTVYWQIPNDFKAMTGAWNAGKPLAQFAPRCKAQQSIAALAANLGGLPRQTAVPGGKLTTPAQSTPPRA